ncbi:MAG TPA: ABC transporter substrate-binding protein [Pseudonocardiaceae bacterium]|jgi:iron complex transport system substrate-binding protein|nr:ABC transporter substrate-binding protein [Pseudonocardiaceae bacterium]
MPEASVSRSARRTVSRRGFLAGAGAVGLGVLATACGVGGENPGAASGSGSGSGTGSGSGPWSFTDDRGTRVATNGRPNRVVAYVGSAAALHDFGVDRSLVGVFGPTKLSNGKADPMAGGLDVDKLTIVGNTYGEFNIEEYATLRPDLLVTNMMQPGVLWYVPNSSEQQILQLAPSIALNSANVSLRSAIQRYSQLAAALGADQNGPSVTDAKARFDKASAALRAATSANPGIRVLAASADANQFYVAGSGAYPDLTYFQSLGVEIVRPDNVVGGFFESLSWENADKYPADLIFLDSRAAAMQPKDLAAKPSWAALPAVKAGQVTPWLSEPRFSYAGCAPHIQALATAIQQAKKLS